MAQSIVRFVNWLRVSDTVVTPVDVVGRAADESDDAAPSSGQPTTQELTAAVVNRLVSEGRTPASAADAARAFYTLNARCATRDEIHDIFVTLDELGFIAD